MIVIMLLIGIALGYIIGFAIQSTRQTVPTVWMTILLNDGSLSMVTTEDIGCPEGFVQKYFPAEVIEAQIEHWIKKAHGYMCISSATSDFQVRDDWIERLRKSPTRIILQQSTEPLPQWAEKLKTQ